MTSEQERLLTEPIKILIVDDHPLMRAGLALQISGKRGLEVCAESEGTDDALEAIKATQPQLAIIDVALKQGHGIDLVKEIKSRFPQVKMLVLSAFEESLYGERALRAGAMGYLNKQETGEKIFDAIRTILAGERYISDEMAKRLIGQAIGTHQLSLTSPVETLSDRELEVFRLIGGGKTTAVIARQLHLSPHTIDTYREKVPNKLNVKTSSELQREAVQWVLENG